MTDDDLDKLIENLEDEDADVRRAAAQALGKIGDVRAVEPLIEHTGYWEAIEALGKIGEPAVEPLLNWASAIAQNTVPWGKIAEVLMIIESESAFEALINIDDESISDINTRHAIIEYLGGSGDPRAARALMSGYRSDRTYLQAYQALWEWIIDTKEENSAEYDEVVAHLIEDFGLASFSAADIYVEGKLLEAINAEVEAGVHPCVDSFIEILGENGDERAVEPLIERLGDEVSVTRLAAAKALDKLGWEPNTDEHSVVYLLAKHDWDAFVKWGGPAVEPLIKALGDSDKDICKAAAGAVGQIGDARAVEPLITALRDRRVVVRKSAAGALGKIGDGRAVEPLIKALGDEAVTSMAGSGLVATGRKEMPVREAAAGALGEIGDERAVEPLMGVLSDDNWRVRRNAAGALDELGWIPETDGQRAAYLIASMDWKTLVEWGAPAVEPLIKTLEDDDIEVRKAAVATLGKIGDERAVEPLMGVLSDDDWRVRGSAAEALGKIGDERAIEPLIKGLERGNSAVARALGEIGDARAVEPLIGALSDDKTWVRKSAAEALGEIGDRRAVEPLIKALGDDDADVRAAAKESLRKLGHEVE
jgi:HEAT repeat protein